MKYGPFCRLTYLIATPPNRSWQRNEGLLLLHSFPFLEILCNMCHHVLRSHRSFIEWNDFLRLCTSCGSTLFSSLRGDTDWGIRANGTFHTSNDLILWLRNDQKEFRNDYGEWPLLSVHPVCQNLFLVTIDFSNVELENLRQRISVSLNWNKDTPLNWIISKSVRRRWNDFVSLKWGYRGRSPTRRHSLLDYFAHNMEYS